MGKWQNTTKHHKREPRGQPFPSKWPQGSNEQTQKHDKHKTYDPQKMYRLGTASKNILLDGLNQFHGANLTLSSDVDQDTSYKESPDSTVSLWTPRYVCHY